jgi:hyperosmotically inducible protein
MYRQEQHARSTTGVVEVRNEIRIRVVSELAEADETGSDAWITTKIKTKITADPQLNPFGIDVDTLDGVVTLSGRVESEEDRLEAETLALDTEGVVSVDNRLEVG